MHEPPASPRSLDDVRVGSKIAVLLATCNGASFLEAQLASLLAQSFPLWRLLARDDGSADATPQILRAWAARHPDRIALLEDGAGQQGVVENFARLLAACDAPWFMCCDQDDVWLPNKLAVFAERMAALESRLGRDTPILIHSDLVVVDRDLAPLAPSYWRRQGLDVRRDGRFRSLLRRNVVTGCACMGNAALQRVAVPIPAEARVHDWWLALVAAAIGHVEVLDCVTMLYRQHGANQIGIRPVSWPTLLGIWLRHPHWEIAAILRRLQPRQLQAKALAQRLGTGMPAERRADCAGFLRARRPRDIVERMRDVWKIMQQQ